MSCPTQESAFLLRRFERDPEARNQAMRYTMIGSALRNELLGPIPRFCAAASRRAARRAAAGGARRARAGSRGSRGRCSASASRRAWRWRRSSACGAQRRARRAERRGCAVDAARRSQASQRSRAAELRRAAGGRRAGAVAPQIRLTNYLMHHGEYASRLSRTSVHSNVVGAAEAACPRRRSARLRRSSRGGVTVPSSAPAVVRSLVARARRGGRRFGAGSARVARQDEPRGRGAELPGHVRAHARRHRRDAAHHSSQRGRPQRRAHRVARRNGARDHSPGRRSAVHSAGSPRRAARGAQGLEPARLRAAELFRRDRAALRAHAARERARRESARADARDQAARRVPLRLHVVARPRDGDAAAVAARSTSKGEIVEQILFTDIELPDSIPAEALAATIDTTGFRCCARPSRRRSAAGHAVARGRRARRLQAVGRHAEPDRGLGDARRAPRLFRRPRDRVGIHRRPEHEGRGQRGFLERWAARTRSR